MIPSPPPSLSIKGLEMAIYCKVMLPAITPRSLHPFGKGWDTIPFALKGMETIMTRISLFSQYASSARDHPVIQTSARVLESPNGVTEHIPFYLVEPTPDFVYMMG